MTKMPFPCSFSLPISIVHEHREMKSSCWLYILKEKQGRRFITSICLSLQTTNFFLCVFFCFKEKAHTCAVYASKYNGKFYYEISSFIAWIFSSNSTRKYFCLALKKSMKFIFPATSSEIYLFCTLLFTFFLPFFFRLFSFIFSTSNEWAHRKGVTLLTFYPHWDFSIFFSFFHRFVYFPFSSSFPTRALDLISFFLLWFGLFSIFFNIKLGVFSSAFQLIPNMQKNVSFYFEANSRYESTS